MIRNHFKIAFRNLWKHRAFTFINVMGLTAGMSACFLIALYVHFELSYDSFNKKADRIYRLSTDLKTTSETLNYSISSWAFAPNLKNEFEEVEAFTRISTRNYLVRKGDLKFKEEKTVFADSSLFNVFDFELIKGDPKTALKDQMSIVFTSISSIVGLLSKDFLILVLLAFFVASPLAWFGMNKWLQNFAYQTDIEWWVFVVAAVLSASIAFATISFQSIKAALMNPVKSLRSE
jgi:hypothetical protein